MKSSKTPPRKDISTSYNRAKLFNGARYTGMAVGRRHHWYYDQGSWKEKKMTPEKWEISYATIKRRAGRAPEGSGVPVGTGYHWFILAHQFVEKLDANDYMTQLVGLKFKLAHRRAGADTWSASDEAQRKHLVKILREMAEALEHEPEQLTPVPLELDYQKEHYSGTAVPVLSACEDGACFNLDITLNRQHFGIMRRTEKGWKISEIKSQGLANAIGKQIEAWYEKRAA